MMRVVAFTRRTAPLPFPPTNARASSCALVSSSSPSIIVPHYDTIYTTIRVHNTKKHTHTHTHTHRARAPAIADARLESSGCGRRPNRFGGASATCDPSIHRIRVHRSIDSIRRSIHPSIHPSDDDDDDDAPSNPKIHHRSTSASIHPPPSWCGRAVIGDSSHDSSNVRASASSRTSGRSDSGGRVVLFV